MTAWLANLLSDGRTLCHHDALAHGGIAGLQSRIARNVGFAETAGMYVPQTLLNEFPGCRFVLLLADMQRVAASLRGIGVDGDAFAAHFTPVLARAVEVFAGRALFVRDVEVKERAAEIVEYLTGAAPNTERLALLRELNIQKASPLAGNAVLLRDLMHMESATWAT